MRYYITDKINVITGLTEYLNYNVIDALDKKIYWVEVVDSGYTGTTKYKIYNENDVLKGYVRIIKKGDRITDTYGNYITHPTQQLYALPIMDDLKYYDVSDTVKTLALQYGTVEDELDETWTNTG